MGCAPSAPDGRPVLPSSLCGLDLGAGEGPVPGLPQVSERDVQFGPMKFHLDQLQVLLVFPRKDSQCTSFSRACEKAGFGCTVAKETKAVLDCFLNNHPDIVIIDHRNPQQLDAVALCRNREGETVQHCSTTHKACPGAVTFPCGTGAQMGLHTYLVHQGFRALGTHGGGGCCVQDRERRGVGLAPHCQRLQQEVCGEPQPHGLLQRAAPAGVWGGALPAETQYANPAFENVMGYQTGELLGAASLEKKVDLLAAIQPCTKLSKEDKALRVHRQTLQQHQQESAAGRHRDRRKSSVDLKVPCSRSSEVSTQRRHSSLARIHSMTIEAPITKVINLIIAAQESSPAWVTEALDQVLETLRAAELYSPQFEAKDDDPHASDLVGGLVSDGLRRLSGNEYVLAAKNFHQGTTSSLHDVPPKAAEAMENEDCWDFNIFELEAATTKRPLVFLGLKIFARFGICEFLGCSEPTLRAWLETIEAHYHQSNPYHNSTHAADVLHATAYFLGKERIKQTLDPSDEAAALIAAVVHDVDHPGRTNSFLCNADSPLALLYNDTAVLESHHAALAFQLTVGDMRCNIFRNMQRSEYRTLRQSIIDMVLATEMTKHFEHVNKFVNSITKPLAALEEDSEDTEGGQEAVTTMLRAPENRMLIKRMLIKCADVANPCRPREQCVEWAARISEEYFSQTDEEKQQDLPVVMPVFDRNTCSIPKSQVSFIDYFISGMFDAWDAFADLPEVMLHLDNNFKYWKGLDELRQRGLRPPPEVVL
ncbi:high affinity cAMP-specific and IBMX-insensitive 3',5'-cyclic phosphodiesterase 8A isoform X3 [Erinaceus europaeus]|uniref:Phosphodiesterase n=1 Tax=Erinaceus europaeus TaxID=9365 RepID=A0ABM3WFV4_ERIEU|nr:high affinity cAMP-specific and IBMX-insensitive 3',5'-cyclic phosphodiesterase 8A isoform X3 [Erinaceus europaeus]